ncbi:MAG TPA: TetR family transcriptional regulator [Solirubrobacterales bacterium]|nr:TetR family transcriptional regulator [Solirubrobacterales bacterium]
MVIPPQARSRKAPAWGALDASAKRARLLAVSHQVFAREGLDAPMPAVAAAAGIGVGSLYRQFPSKHELLTALVIERLEEVIAGAEAALGSDAGPWAALTAFLWDHCERAVGDDVLAEAIAALQVDPAVKRVRARSTAALQALLDAAKAEGEVREDATALDLRLLFAAARAAEQVEAGAWRRALELGLDSLARR